MTDGALAALVSPGGRLPGTLKILNLGFNRAITSAGAAQVALLTALTWLSLGRCAKVNDAALCHLTALTGLETLNLDHVHAVTPFGTEALTERNAGLTIVGLQ